MLHPGYDDIGTGGARTRILVYRMSFILFFHIIWCLFIYIQYIVIVEMGEMVCTKPTNLTYIHTNVEISLNEAGRDGTVK